MTASLRRLAVVTATVGLYFGALNASSLGVSANAGAQQGRPEFATAIDLVQVDVQVVDSRGLPVEGLTPDKFEVRISGRKRRVVSADLINFGQITPRDPMSSTSEATATPILTGSTPITDNPPRRIVILAIDCSSVDESTGRPILIAAAEYVRRLRPHDEVGLFSYPIGPKVDPTTDHEAVIRALQTVVARREMPTPGRFNFSPADLVELSREPPTEHARRVRAQLCGDPPPDPQCPLQLDAQVFGDVLMYEGIAQTGILTLRDLFAELGKVPERKTVVLVSGGIVSSDLPGARPDHQALSLDAGRIAARSNVTLYALYVDQTWIRQMSAESARPPSTINPVRDSSVTGKWLDELSGAAGGTLVRVTAGNGAAAFDRVLLETSAYYLLGVEPVAEDRDGRPHELRVKVDARHASVRGRSWVVIPKPGAGLPDAVPRGRATAAAPATPPPPTRLPPPPPVVRRLADAFDRNDRAAMDEALRTANPGAIIKAFQDSESPWPERPRRTAAFALDLALRGLRSDVPFARDESLRLLAEYAVRARQPAVNDPFECTWLWTASAGLAGLFSPAAGIPIAERGVERCPGDPNLLLTRAVLNDQQLVLNGPEVVTNAASARHVDDNERRVLDQFQRAAIGDAMHEAQVRAAFVHLRAGRVADGLALIDSMSDPAADDRQVRYLKHLAHGQLLRLAGRPADAIRAYREALTVWPGAQAARVALMTLLVNQGEREEAADLAERVMAAPGPNGDPWWLYPLGDYRLYPTIRARLLEVAR